MTELIPISQPPTKDDGDANGQVFAVFRGGNKLLVEWNHSTMYGADFWAKTDYDPPKRPTRIVYGEPVKFARLPVGSMFEIGGRLYAKREAAYWRTEDIATGITSYVDPWQTVTQVTFE